ncbi:sec-independent protein translocase protein TatC [Haloplanus vescus]|uniref:Sec-independent protein translocase protein TatC n=1 Tax=Haloplanus vescus TaxID=555874 RepID=A0A1H3Z7G3_9EURY|nr:twin-arginine translocase subunit TatC [Haloplanus vescus]SEA19585.1 sec-independent protein translocase protein TatC [Haloplanus vescus]
MAEEPESGSPSESPTDGDSSRSSTDAESDEDDIPGGSIEDFVDDESVIRTDEQAPMGATGTPDPFDPEERKNVSDAVGAPVPDSELDDDPDIELDPSVDSEESVIETDDDPSDESVIDTDEDNSVVERDDESVTGGESQTEAPTEASEAPAEAVATETPAEPAAPETVDEPADPAPDGDVAEDGILGEGPASDEEMPLADHIEEMVRRLGVVLVVGGIVALAVFPFADQIINFLWNSHIPGAQTITDRRPRLYGPLELLVTELKVSALAGFVVGLPIAVYETYLFMRPGLFPRERRYYLAAVPTSLVLALIGVAFAHFVVLPAIFAYFTSYTTGTAVVAFGLKETFSLILVLMGYMALVFQIPLFIMLAIMMNLTTRAWLEQRRFLFWGGFLGVAFLVSPDPTGMAPIIVAATMIGLFEGTLALLRWTGN